MPTYLTNALRESLRRLGATPFPRAARERLSESAAAINRELTETVLAEIPAFRESGNPDSLPDLAAHCPLHTAEVIRLLGGGAVGDFEFVAEHARRRAERRFPLEATLHAYRCGHKVFSRWLRDAVLACLTSTDEAPDVIAAVADFTIEYTDAISTAATSAYVSHTRLLADVAGDYRAELLSVLLEGFDESDGRVSKILRDAGYLDARQSFCVVLARSVEPTEMLNPARARRLADSLRTALEETGVRSLVDLRDNKVTGVVSYARRASGWTAPRTDLATRLATALRTLGNAVVVGVSNDVPSTSQIPAAHREARHALELAHVGERVVQFAGIPTRTLLMQLAGAEFRKALPPWSGDFASADHKQRGVLTATLRAYADASMNVLQAAQALAVHPNTVYARVQRIHDITGRDARSFHDLSELLIVAECLARE